MYKLIANFSATRVTSLPSLSLTERTSHTIYIGSASALPIINTKNYLKWKKRLCARLLEEMDTPRFSQGLRNLLIAKPKSVQ